MPAFPALIQITSNIDPLLGFRTAGVGGNALGFRVSGAGDFNGDGFEDFLVSGPGLDLSNGEGGAYLVFGRASGFPTDLTDLDGTNGFLIFGALVFDYAGWSVSGGGDFNGDGLGDLIIGMNASNYVGTGDDRAFVVFGSAGPFGSTLLLGGLAAGEGAELVSGSANGGLGRIVVGDGDFNGDGWADVIVGEYAGGGTIFVLFGDDQGFDLNTDLTALDGYDGFAIQGGGLGFGRTIAVADFDDDGRDDILAGVPGAAPNGGESGGAYLIFGSASTPMPTLNVGALGANGLFFAGASGFDQAGTAVSSAGDVNGDGVEDILIGARTADFGGTYTGSAYVVFGDAAASGTIQLSALDGTNGFRIDGAAQYDAIGQEAASAGDVNGDGFDDIVLGSFRARPGGTSYGGKAWVVYGKGTAFTATLSVGALDGSNGFTVEGLTANLSLGQSVAGADINDDGLGDILIGASGISGAYVILGRISQTTGAGGGTLNGGGSSDELTGLGGKDTLNGNEGEDVLDGGGGNDTLDGGGGADDLVGGLGNDILNGGSGDDVISDASGSNKLNGGDGDDVLTGSSGADRLNGENDDDTLDGGEGNDYLDGGSGVNTMTGGIGNDIFIVRSTDDTVIEAFGQGTDTVRSTISYTLTNNVEVLELLGAAANGTGNELANMLRGNSSANTLSGLAGADRLEGGDGNDILIGGAGRDTLTGGAGGDTFRVLDESVLQSPLEIDTITDFDPGLDTLDFSQIDANGAAAGDPAFIVSTTGLHRIAGELYVFYTASQNATTVRLDINGDGVADYQLRLNGGDYTADSEDWML